jgi:hypothetical protein
VAATLETAAKGVIYEHAPQSILAGKLAAELTALLQQLRDEGGTVYDREAVVTLRAIEQGARSVRGPSDAKDAYLTLMGRLLQVNRATESSPPSRTASSIILP